jgi:hypothetical protein
MARWLELVYTADSKSAALGLAGSNPARATNIKKKEKKMSWSLTQQQYKEFITTWQRSITSCEALGSLLESSTFPDEIEIPYSSMYYGTHSDKLTHPKIQGIANALRQKGVALKSLKIDPKNKAKPKSKYLPGATSRHLDFDELATLVE